jgi:chemotaxis protein CheZ
MINEQTLEQAKALVASLESGNEAEAHAILDEIAQIRENNLFQEIGKLTRDLHDTLNSFQMDNRITELAAQDIPDAKDRLEYVLELTAQSANKTMDCVEEGIHLSDSLKVRAARLNDNWQLVRNKEVTGEQFRNICSDTESFIDDSTHDTIRLHELFNEVLLAQDFQDLTGQVIKRVIQLVQDVEGSLVNTIKTFGALTEYQDAVETGKKDEKGPVGPAMNADIREDVVANQDDVDDLLSSLGF